MRRITLILAASVLAGCGAPAPYRATNVVAAPVDRALAECEYDAEKATANIRNGFEAGWMKGTLRRKCMELKGYTQ